MSLQHEQELDLLERVARYREDYRSGRAASLQQEREQHHANGEVNLGGVWLRAPDADRIGRALQRREYLVFFEIALLLALLIAVALGLSWLFNFLFLPD